MKKITAMLLACLCLGSMMVGCSGTISSPGDRARRYWLITEVQSKQFNDDLDYLLLMERNSRLSEYHARVGK